MPRSGRAWSFPQRERLTRRAEFQAVFDKGARVERPSVLVLWRMAGRGLRAGFTVSRGIQGVARRNRARRRVREAYRVNRQTLPGGVQLVVVARPAAEKGPFAEVLRDVREALEVVATRCRQAGEA